MKLKELLPFNKNNIKKVFPFVETEYSDDSIIILKINSYTPTEEMREGQTTYFDYNNSMFSLCRKMFDNKRVVLKFDGITFEDDTLNLSAYFVNSDQLNIQFDNCVFKNGINKFITTTGNIGFNNCTFDGKTIISGIDMTSIMIDEINGCYTKYNFHDKHCALKFINCKFFDTVTKLSDRNDYEILFKECEFLSNVSLVKQALQYLRFVSRIEISDCSFDNKVHVEDEEVEFNGNNNFNSNLVVEGDDVILTGNNIVKGNTNIEATKLHISNYLLKTKNLYLKITSLFNSNSRIEADESVEIDSDDTKKCVISSPKVVYNGHDITTDNNSMMDVYPNEKYKKILIDKNNIQIERKRLLLALLSVHDMITSEIEKQKKELEQQLDQELKASSLRKYITK